jgi:hypothetical protein
VIVAPVVLVLSLVPSPAAWLVSGRVWVRIGLILLFGRSRAIGPLRWT